MHTTYFWHTRLSKLFLKNDKLLHLLDGLSMDVGNGKNLRIYHVDSSVLYSSERDETELMLEAADYFIENPTQSSTFHAALFSICAKWALAELSKVHAKYAAGT